MKNPEISVVSPVYMAEFILDELIKRLRLTISKITDSYEILLVEDHSPDGSWRKIEQICNKYPEVKGIKLSRNFGQHSAIDAGLHHTSGDYVIVMDCDLQDNPDYIPDLLQLSKEGYDIVYTIKEKRNHDFFKNITAYFYYFIFNYLSAGGGIKSHENVGNYSMISKKVVNEYRKLNDEFKPYIFMLKILGFNSTFLKIKHDERFSGKSSYSYFRLVKFALNDIISHSDRLLRLSINIGLIYMFVSSVYGGYILYQAIDQTLTSGWPSIVLIIIFGTGIILLFFGAIGLYISRIFMQVKNRPHFIVDGTLNL